MNGSPRILRVLAVLVIVVVSVAMFSFYKMRAPAPASTNPVVTSGPDPAAVAALESMHIPEFTLIDQNGNMVTRDVFAGHWTVLDFMFSYCTLACPVLNQNMLSLSGALAGTPVRFLSISVDPAHDTPLRLLDHAHTLGADLKRWTFLTEAGAEAGTVRKIAVDGLGFVLAEDAQNIIRKPDGTSMNNIAHPTRFMLVGPDLVIRGIYRGNDPEDLTKLAEDARRLSAPGP